MSEDVSVERLSVAEAADALGVTRDAIHKRIRRRSVKYEKGEDRRFYVYIDTSTPVLDQSVDKSKDESKVETLERLIEGQQDHIAFLERELERRVNETTRLHQIVAGLTQANTEQARTIRAIEAPQEEPEAAEMVEEMVEEAPERAEPRSAAGGAQEGLQRPWWRRMFGA